MYIVIGIVVGVIPLLFISKNSQPVDINVGERFLRYENKELFFTMIYPEYINEITQNKEGISFAVADSPDQWSGGFGVRITPTSFSSIDEWIAAQPIGSGSAPGIKVLAKLGGNNSYAISNFEHVDSDGEKLIYGQKITGVMVMNGNLYELAYLNQFPANETPSIDPLFAQVIASMGSLE